MADVARKAGVKALVGSMMEGDRGVYAAAAVAATIAPDAVHDLDASWWATDSEIKYVNGEVSLA
jgi:L-alanine-DL-glutamate epimerase-like enolase superfamily enzyme